MSRWSFGALTSLVLLVATGASVPSASQPSERITFDGKWYGTYLDSINGKGAGVYYFTEDKNERFTGKVTWIFKGEKQSMDLTGERLGANNMKVTGKHKTTTYRYIGGMHKNELLLHYLGEDDKSGESHFGLSTLTRQEKKKAP